jgi:hypothetical protein
MTLFPRHPILRIVATAWLLASVVMLLATLLRPEIGLNDRAALSSLVPLYFLSFPLGHVSVVALSRLKVDLYVSFGMAPGIFSEGLLLWILLTVFGYTQWFVLLPWLARKSRKLTDFLFDRYFAR